MTVALKNIPGLMINEVLVNAQNRKFSTGFNDAITQQGSVKITLSREKLATIIHKWFTTKRNLRQTIEQLYGDGMYELTDEIISQLGELVEKSQ